MDNRNVISTLRLLVWCLVLLGVGTVLTLVIVFDNHKQTMAEAPTFGCGVVGSPIDFEMLDSTAALGSALFNHNCKSCHAVTGDVVIGPGLRDIEKRRSLKWIVRWVHNPMKMVASGDRYAKRLYKKYNQTQMTAFPTLTETEIKQILHYINQMNNQPIAIYQD